MMLTLEYTAQILFELHSMRRECSEFASRLMRQRPLNERGLEECARSLARAVSYNTQWTPSEPFKPTADEAGSGR